MKSLDFTTKQYDQTMTISMTKLDSARTSGLPAFKLPFSNQKPRKAEEVPVLQNSVSSGILPRPKTKLALKLDIPSSTKLEVQPKQVGTGFSVIINNNKSNSFRPVNSPEPKIMSKHEPLISPKTRKLGSSETIMIRVPSSNVTNTNSPAIQKPFLRIPISDLYKGSDVVKTKRSSTLPSCDENQAEPSPKNNGCSGSPFDTFEEHQNDSARKQNRVTTLCSTTESSAQLQKTKTSSLTSLNFSSSPGEKHRKLYVSKTIKEIGLRSTFHGPKPEAVDGKYVKVVQISDDSDKCSDKGVPASKNKQSKAIHRITDAFEKAKIFNDQVILQHQFDKQNEEEERDFCELYEMLQSNIGE